MNRIRYVVSFIIAWIFSMFIDSLGKFQSKLPFRTFRFWISFGAFPWQPSADERVQKVLDVTVIQAWRNEKVAIGLLKAQMTKPLSIQTVLFVCRYSLSIALAEYYCDLAERCNCNVTFSEPGLLFDADTLFFLYPYQESRAIRNRK